MTESVEDTNQKKGSSWQRMSSADFAVAEEVLRAAAHYLVPDELTARQAFRKFLPDLYVLRNKGCSFSQLAELLRKCGLNLQPSTVRVYYSEMISERQDECQRRMNEQILLLAQVRKETKGVDVSTIADKLAKIEQAQRAAAAQKIDTIFITPDLEPVQKSTPPLAARGPATPARVKPSTKRSMPVDDGPGVPVLATNSSAESIRSPTAPPAPTDLTSEKNLAATPHHEEPTPRGALVCKPLQTGVRPLQRKPTVDESVYQPGELEHPAIPGLILNMEQRLYSAALEIVDVRSGEMRHETIQEKRFRVIWQKPIPMTKSSTSDSFVKMDSSLFKKQ